MERDSDSAFGLAPRPKSMSAIVALRLTFRNGRTRRGVLSDASSDMQRSKTVGIRRVRIQSLLVMRSQHDDDDDDDDEQRLLRTLLTKISPSTVSCCARAEKSSAMRHN